MRRGAALLVLVALRPAFAEGTGTVRGTVRLDGLPPPPRLVDMRGDPGCPRVPVLDDEVVLGPGRGLANVYVAIDTLEVHPNWWDVQTESRAHPVEMTLTGCRLRPRVVIDLFGQPFRVKNADRVEHDLVAPHELEMWIAPGATAERNELSVPGIMPLGSDRHPWIAGAVFKAQTPFFALSGGDGGYVISGIPPGTWPLTFIHERYGARRAQVTVTAGGVASVDLTFTGGVEKPEAEEPCALLADRPLPPPTDRPASAARMRASRKISEPIAKGVLPGDEELGDMDRRRLALQRLIDALELEPANDGARVTFLELAFEAHEEASDYCRDPVSRTHDRQLLHRWVVTALGQLVPAVRRGCNRCMELVSRIDDGKAGGMLASAPDVSAALDALHAGPQTPIADATRALIAALELSTYGAGEEQHTDPRAWAKVARHVDEARPIKIKLLVGGADPPDDVAWDAVTGRKALGRWAAKAFSPEMGNGGDISGDLTCNRRCCDIHHTGENIMRTDLNQVCFDDQLRVVSMIVEEGGP